MSLLKHMENLENLCRVCGKNIMLNKSYTKVKSCQEYSSVLENSYNIFVVNEDSSVFPKSLCQSCKRKLDKLKINSKFIGGAADFVAHDVSCNVCSITQPSRRSNKLHLKTLDTLMENKNFLKLVHVDDVKRIYLRPSIMSDNNTLSVTINVTVHNDDTWKCWVNKIAVENCYSILNFTNTLNDENIVDFADLWNDIKVCPGNKDFGDVIDKRFDFKEPFPSVDGHGKFAHLESSTMSRLEKEEFTVIRGVKCDFLTKLSSGICTNCSEIRNNLRVIRWRQNHEDEQVLERRTSDSSTSNLRFLSRLELERRYRNCQKQKSEALQKVLKLSLKIEDCIKKDGVIVSNNQEDLFKKIITDNKNNFEEETPQWLLWQQQNELAGKADSRGMRWHPLMIRWCLSIYHKSPGAYKQMSNKSIGFLKLPHVNTLKKYINFTDPVSGFNADVIENLVTDSHIHEIPEFQKNVSIVFDEMKIKSDLVFRKSTGQLVGFTEMGDINEEFRQFESYFEDESVAERDFATYVIVFMVRGIMSSLIYPFGYFASLGFTSAQLYPCVWDAADVLESLGFYVRAFVSDGASPNRKFYHIMTDIDIFWTWNLLALDRKVYFFSDIPHLLKTTRNCFENSHGNLNTRHLHLDGMDISWNHLVHVYEWDLGLHRGAPGLRFLYKLKEEHIRLSPRLRMQVKLAAQVLSTTAYKCLEYENLHYTKSTINFMKMFDRVFDCLNGSSMNKAKRVLKPELVPYESTNDWRFEFLETDFVENYLDRWEHQANETVGMTKDEKNRLCLSKQTLHGWRMTIKSFVELTKLMLEQPGASFVMAEKYSQDPLEQHFSRQRSAGGSNENPNLYQFGNQEMALNVMRSEMITELRGNTGRNAAPHIIDIHDIRKLPQRKRK